MKFIFIAFILTLLLIACEKEQDLTPAIPTAIIPSDTTTKDSVNNGGSGNQDPSYTVIGTDPTGDASGGLDATEIAFLYDKAADEIKFRVKVTDMASFASSPSIDFNFLLPNGTDGNKSTGTPFRGSFETHKTASIYTDNGGSPPSSYSYSNTTGYAVNGIAYTEDVQSSSNGTDLSGICQNCIDIEVDTQNNWIVCTMDRKDIITDSEVGSTKTAKIKLSSNVGFQRANNDLTNDGGEFSITIN